GAHRLRRTDPNFFYRLYTAPGIQDDGESGCKCDEEHGRKITEAKPENEKRRISQPGNRIADAYERQEKILGPAVPADDDSKPHSDQCGEQKCQQQMEHCVRRMEGKDSVGHQPSKGGCNRFDGRKQVFGKRPEKRKRLPSGPCYDEGKDKLRKGDKPSSHFGGDYLMRSSYVNLRGLLVMYESVCKFGGERGNGRKMAFRFGREQTSGSWLRVRPRSFLDWEKTEGVLPPKLCDQHKHEEGTPMLLEQATLRNVSRAMGEINGFEWEGDFKPMARQALKELLEKRLEEEMAE